MTKNYSPNNIGFYVGSAGVMLLIFVLGFGALMRWQTQRQDDLVRALRQELKDELRVQMRQELLTELKVEMARQIQTQALEKAQAFSPLAAVPQSAGVPETEPAVKWAVWGGDTEKRRLGFRDSIQRLARLDQVRREELADETLAEYVAGAEAVQQVPTPVGWKAVASTATVPNPQVAAEVEPESKSGSELPPAVERTFQGRGTMLFPKGTLQYEPSLTYAAFSSNRLNINGFTILQVLTIGTVNNEKIKRDVLINTHTVRYGLADNLQGEMRIPFRAEYDRITASDNSYNNSRSSSGLGDVEFGLSRQVAWEHGMVPDMLWAVNLKTPTGRPPYNNDIATGTGHWGLRNSLIAVHSSDPAVLFGNLSYTYNFERTGINDYGDVKPGDSIGWGVGTAIALSYQTAITFGFDQSITFKMERNGEEVVDSFVNSANFKTGLNYALDEKHSIDFSLGIGLTNDSPDFTVDLRFPILF